MGLKRLDGMGLKGWWDGFEELGGMGLKELGGMGLKGWVGWV